MSNYNTLKTADTINTVSIVDGAITTSKLGASVTTLIVAGGGPKATAITYPGNDLAADPAGGQTITLTGTGFVAGCSIFIGTTQASVVTVVSATSVTFTAPALAAATYTLYLVNPDGGTATIVPGISYSGTPTWSTSAGTLGSVYEYAAISNTVAATGDGSIAYSVFSGTLPTGSVLNTSTGVITGTSPASAGATTYTFVIRATDAQLQDSDRSFSITVNTDIVTWTTPADNSTTTLGKDVASSTTLLATSAAGRAITYTANTLPTGLSIVGDAVTGTPTVAASTTSTFTATAATTGKTATRTINWTVSVASDTYFPYTTLLLSGSASTETFITDASTNNFTLTIAGDTKPNNFNPYTPGYYSMYSPTTSDYYSYSDTTTGNFGTGDFTVEGWFYATASAHNIIMNSVGTATWAFLTYGNQFYWQENGGNYGGGGYGTVPTNQWVHLAASRTGGYLNLYINGVRVLNSANTYNYSGTPTRYIGPAGGGSSSFWLSNVRFIKGTGIYSGATITVPTSPLTAIANTSLLTAQSNRMIDNSANAIVFTKAGSPTVQSLTPFVPNTAYASYGSTYFDGTSDQLTVASPNQLTNFGTGDFTVEFWIYINVTLANTAAVISNYSDFYINSRSNGTIGLTNATTVYALTAGTLNAGTWYHIAVVRSSGSSKIYTNGVGGTAVACTVNFNSTNTVYIGGDANGTWNSYIANLRVVKGVAVYTANFTVPTAPLTATQSANTNGNPSAEITGTATSLLTCQTNQPASNSMFLDSSTNALAVTRTGNTSAGTFSPYGANWSNYFDGSDGLVPAAGLSTAMGTGFAGNIISFELWIYPTSFTNGSDGNGIMGAYAAVSANGRWVVIIERSATTTAKFSLTYTISTGASVTVESTASAITMNQWNHIAITVDATTAASSTIKLFANGVLLNTFTGQNMSTHTTYYRQVYIGDVQSQYVSPMIGYISNFRILKGAFAYTANYTVPTAPLTATANTVFLTCQSNGLVDNSINAFAISKSGDTSVQRFSPFSPQTQTPITHSAYFDGTGDYLTMTSNASLGFGTGLYTVECWVYATAAPALAVLFAVGAGGLQLALESGTGYIAIAQEGIGWLVSSSTLLPLNVWNHVAVSRADAGLTKIFLNGTQIATGTNTTNFLTGTYANINLNAGNSSKITGYISNVRAVKGVAVYTANFTPPTAPLTATQSANTNGNPSAAITGTQTSLLTLQSPTFVDNSSNNFALTAFDNARPRTVNPFGFTNATAAYSAATYGASAYFDGTTDYLTVPASSAQFGTGNFTIEFWINVGSSALVAIMEFRAANGATFGQIYLNTDRTIHFYLPTDIATSNTITLSAWNHVAISRSSGTLQMFINGVSGYSGTQSGTFNAATATIGASFSGATGITGYISNLRFVTGTAVYTSNFVPPAAPLTAITNTSLLLNMNSAGIYDSASGNNLETVADAKRVPTHTPYAGSYYSNYFDGSGDVFTVSNNSGFNFAGDFIIEAWLYPTAFGQGSCNFMTHWSSGSNVYVFRVLNTGRLQFLYTSGATTLTGTSTTVSLNQWSHVAVCRSGSTLRIFVNGIADTTTATYSGTLTGGGPIAVGAHNDTSEGWTGYISNLRVVNTPSSPYTTTFTPSTTPFTSITGTALLTCQSNRFIDNSSNAGTITKSGNVAVQSFNPFQRNSGTSLYFDGTGDYLKAPYNPGLVFGTGDFTIECWLYQVAFVSDMVIISSITTWASSVNFYFGTRAGAPNILIFRAGDSIPITLNGNTAILANSWTHVAVSRASGVTRMFVDGVAQSATHTGSINIGTTAQSTGIGASNNASEPINGYINDLRITKGIARYTTTFTPPTTAFITR